MWAGGQVQAPGWSDQELLLLLEGVELYGDSWADIAEHVGTKSQARLPPAPSLASLVRKAGSASLGAVCTPLCETHRAGELPGAFGRRCGRLPWSGGGW